MSAPSPGPRSPLGWLRSRLSFLASPAWYRAPILLFRYPGLVAAVVGAILVLSVASAAGPLFLSSSGNAALRDSVDRGCPWDVALHVSLPFRFTRGGGFGPPLSLTAYSADLQRGVRRDFPDLQPMERFGIGSSASVTKADVPDGPSAAIRPAFRDGFLDGITPLTPARGEGMWLAQSTARRLGVAPGDRLHLRSIQDGRADIGVAGIYRDLAAQPRSDFWCLQESLIYPFSAFDNYVPPPFGLVDATTFADLERTLKETGAPVTFAFLPRPDLTLPEARTVAARIRGFSPHTEAFVSARADSRYPFLVDQAVATVESLRGPIETIAIAGRLVALMVIAAAGVFWVGRRRAEVKLLSARGTGAAGMITKVILESIVPAAAAAVGGALAARWLVAALGPSGTIDAPSTAAADQSVMWSALVALVLLGAAAAFPALRVLEAGTPRRTEGLRRYPWELVVLALAGAALYEILTRGGATVERVGEPPKVDRFLLLFPILFVAGGAGLAVRGLRRLLPGLRALGSRWRPSAYLATRRLAGSSGAALTLLVGASVAIGVLVYSATLSASVRATSVAKAAVFVGSDLDVTLLSQLQETPGLGAPVTLVRRIERASVDRESNVDVIGVDPATFGGAAFWDDGFASMPLDRVLGLLSAQRPDGRVPVVVTGDQIPVRGLLRLPGSGSAPTPIDVILRTSSFPGMRAGSSLLVMQRERLVAATSIGQDHLWVKGNPAVTEPAVKRSGLSVVRTVSVTEVGQTPEFLSLSHSFDFLQALGIMAGVIALAGGVLQMEAKQREREVSYALLRRMGLSRGSHRLSVVLELGFILVLSVGVGSLLAWLAAGLVLGRLDPLPNIPPTPLFRVPVVVLVGTGVAALLASWAGALWVQRTADRVRVSEVMRVAG